MRATGFFGAAAAAAIIGICVFARGARPGAAPSGPPATASPVTGIVLVELFTSEGCSDCPEADHVLREINGKRSSSGQLIVGVSEHVTYWNRLGWSDPYSTVEATDRQSRYGSRFDLDSVYTPQMVVNGREQFVGGNHQALRRALDAELAHAANAVHIVAAEVTGSHLELRYEVDPRATDGAVELQAMITDDTDRSEVLRGENAGKTLEHTGVVRATLALRSSLNSAEQTAEVPLPQSVLQHLGDGHHVVVFAQRRNLGPVEGVDSRAF